MSDENNNNNKDRTIRCTLCRMEMLDSALPPNTSSCPGCGTEALPEFVDHDVDVRINWHELRILCMWAKNWELDRDLTTYPSIIDIITKQLEKYRPVDGAPLSLLGELTEVAEELGLDATLTQEDEVTEIKGKRNLH